MFKARSAPRGGRRKQTDDADEPTEALATGSEKADVTIEKLAEVREIQRLHWKKPRGVDGKPACLKPEEKVDEEEEEHWGLDAGFSGSSGQKQSDPHLEAFLNERLFKKVDEAAAKKEKTREEKLYEVPESLQVSDFTEGAADKMSWVAGLAEVPLGVEYKIANIEATEKAKREFLHGEGRIEKPAVLEPDAITRKAFGTRFINFADRGADSKSATDDAVLERFRKRMRR